MGYLAHEQQVAASQPFRLSVDSTGCLSENRGLNRERERERESAVGSDGDGGGGGGGGTEGFKSNTVAITRCQKMYLIGND